MNRRDFLKTTGTTSLLAGLPILNPGPRPLPARLIPEDKGITPEVLAALRQRGQRRVYRDPHRFALGMPCGGIAAGQLYVLGDGTLGGWHVDGRLNFTGWGADCYKVRPHTRELIQGFTVLVNNPDEKKTGKKWLEARLAGTEHGGSFEPEFIGEYPIAEIRYRGTGFQPMSSSAISSTPLHRSPAASPFPLDISLKVHSPFIPLNAKDSALPCTLLRFTVTNTSDRVIHGQLVGYLENGVDKPQPGEIAPLRRNRHLSRKGLSTILMEALPRPDAANPRPDRPLFDFEGQHYVGWEVKGGAFGPGPATGVFPKQQAVTGFEGKGFVNSFAGDDDLTGELTSEPFVIDRQYLTFLIGGGSHAGKTCINLLVDGKPVRTATGHSQEKLEPHAWDVGEFAGKAPRLQIVDAQKGPWGHINIDSVQLADRVPDAAKRPRPDSLAFGTMALAVSGSAVVDVPDVSKLAEMDLAETSRAEQATRDDSGSLVGAGVTSFDLSPGQSSEHTFIIAWHFPNLHTGNGVMYSNHFKDAAEVAGYVHDNLERLVRDTELFRRTWYDDTTLPWWLALRLFMPTANLATGTAQWWKNGRFWGWEGVGCCHGTCTHVWNYSHAEARLFPELARSTRVMQDLGTGFEESTGRVAFRGEVDKGFEYAGDGQSGTVLKCYREHLCSPDDSYLKTNWPKIKKVLDFQIARDAAARAGSAADPDGIIEITQHNTYDIDFHGPNTFVGSLYLASLLAGARMAEAVGDAPTGERYRDIARRGREYTEKHLFENGYFVQRIPEDASPKWQYGRGCLADQLFGQNWARCLNLGTLYDEEKVTSALRCIFKYNWAPAVGQYNAKFPPERWFAEGREGGLFICTWPMGGRSGEPVRYRDEVWTGCEYQATGGMVWEGLLDEALVMIKAIDDRYDGAVHNPWNEVECGDHYARAMASYGVYQAMCGFTYDGPAGAIGIAPRLNPENFAAFFAGAEGWGLTTQRREGRAQVNRFEVRWGKLRVTTVLAEMLADTLTANAEARVNARAVPAELEQKRGSVRVRLAEPVVLRAGDAVEVVLSSLTR